MFIHVSYATNKVNLMVLFKCNGRRTDRINAKNVYPVMEVVLLAVNVDAEVVRSAYVPNK